jgi:hypothetical protein
VLPRDSRQQKTSRITQFQSNYFRNVQKNHHLMIQERSSTQISRRAARCLVLMKRNDSRIGFQFVDGAVGGSGNAARPVRFPAAPMANTGSRGCWRRRKDCGAGGGCAHDILSVPLRFRRG